MKKAGDAFLGFAVRKEMDLLNKKRGEAAVPRLVEKVNVSVFRKRKQHVLCYSLLLPMSVATEEAITSMLEEVAGKLNLILSHFPC